jgi:TolA-binding protein
MSRTRQGSVCAAALLLACGGTMAAESIARLPSRSVADDAVRKDQGVAGPSNQGAARLPIDDEFESAPKLFRQGRFAEAERQFAWIARVRKDTTWGERAQYYLAECQFQQKNYVGALASYERLHYDYPATNYLEKLVGREYEIARFWLAQSDPKVPAERKLPRTAQFDGRLPLFDVRAAALRALEHVRNNNPEGPLADAAGIQIADSFMERHDYQAAVQYYDQFLESYRRSPFRSHARLAAIEARIRGDIEPRWDAAVDKVRELVEQIMRTFSNPDEHGNRNGRYLGGGGSGSTVSQGRDAAARYFRLSPAW